MGDDLSLQAVLGGQVWENDPASGRPQYVALSPILGVVGIEVCDVAPSDIVKADRADLITGTGLTPNPVVSLGPKLEELRRRVGPLEKKVPVRGVVCFTAMTREELDAFGRAFPARATAGRDELEDLQTRWSEDVDPGALHEVREQLYPDVSLDVELDEVEDADRDERERDRAVFDEKQRALAASLSSSTTIVEGVAGSGKSLILAARARALHAAHPDWDIGVFCFNRTLVAYLEARIGHLTGIHVGTVYTWLGGLGIRLPSFKSDPDGARLREALHRAARDRVGAYSLDAVLVDEAQDLSPEMLQLLQASVRSDEGGVLIVRDLAQSLYSEHTAHGVREPYERVALLRNYRNTEQIGRFALSSVFGTSRSDEHDPRRPVEAEYTHAGEPVQVVWSESREEQARFVAYETTRLISSGIARPEEIGVLYTQYKGQLGYLSNALDAEDVPVQAVTWDRQTKDDLDLRHPSVKALTVHSAKGLEFPIVFLFGVEALRVPETMEGAEEKEANFARVAYVGMTRAKDVLYLTYTKANPIIRRSLELSDLASFRRFPDDYLG